MNFVALRTPTFGAKDKIDTDSHKYQGDYLYKCPTWDYVRIEIPSEIMSGEESIIDLLDSGPLVLKKWTVHFNKEKV
jgi:hypothetical protein